jgi:hypothetical protein
MIRDPSDGSVREAPKAEVAKVRSRATPEPDTGVRQPTKTDAMMRLEFSREWLKNYHAKKEARHADGGSNEQSAGDVQDRAGG